MALTTTAIISLALAAAAAGTSYYNTQQTNRRTDNALALQIADQGKKQKQADSKVNEEVAKLQASRADDERQKALSGYLDTLRKGKGELEAGLTPGFGSAAFQQDSAKGAQGVEQFAADRAGLLSRMDAPLDQRRGEGYDYGRLGTDLDLISRDARGQNFLDELNTKRASRRNAGLDALASFLGGLSTSGLGAGAGASAGASGSAVYSPTGLGAGAYWTV